LVRLEEEYYEYHSSMTRCWEELIQCNADILSHFKDAIRDHDRSISAKTCPTSILPQEATLLRFQGPHDVVGQLCLVPSSASKVLPC
ncbi:hypothetical protein EDC04DRAFT_2577992, partial [Pisolithus marmoratus]